MHAARYIKMLAAYRQISRPKDYLTVAAFPMASRRPAGVDPGHETHGKAVVSSPPRRCRRVVSNACRAGPRILNGRLPSPAEGWRGGRAPNRNRKLSGSSTGTLARGPGRRSCNTPMASWCVGYCMKRWVDRFRTSRVTMDARQSADPNARGFGRRGNRSPRPLPRCAPHALIIVARGRARYVASTASSSSSAGASSTGCAPRASVRAMTTRAFRARRSLIAE